MCFYGVGNHGGGPTKENIESIRRLNGDPCCPTLLFSTPDRFFESALEKGASFPVVHDELQHHAVGCYSAHSGVKRWNRRAENALLAAEKLSCVAACVAGQPYPDDLAHAWKTVLFNQFHDILAGTSIESAYEDARDGYGEATAIASRALNHAVQSLAWRVRIEPEERMKPIFVFNPHSWPVRAGVELEFGRLLPTDVLLDEEDREAPVQALRSEATVGSSRTRLCFVADLPPMGYRVYRLLPGHGEQAEPAPIDPASCELENEALRLSIDPETGYVAGLFDKRAGHEVFRGPAAVPLVLSDTSDTWSHGVSRYDDPVGTFKATSVRLVERGPVKSVLRVVSEYGDSRLTQEFALYTDLERVDVRVTVDWRERFKLLKLRFPLNLYFTTATYEAPYGHVERASTGDEEPGQSWVDMTGIARGSGAVYGLSLLNDGKYSYSTREAELDLTVLRSPIYAHHEPYVPVPGEEYTFMDQGIQQFTYSLLPHGGDWKRAGTARRAAELNQPPIALVETYHDGPLPMTDSYLRVDAESVVVGALKQAEDNGDLIVRCHEQHGTPARARIELRAWGRTIEAEFGPCEIKTFRVPRDESLPIIETDLLEWAE
jgi:alpha-mannosidase